MQAAYLAWSEMEQTGQQEFVTKAHHKKAMVGHYVISAFDLCVQTVSQHPTFGGESSFSTVSSLSKESSPTSSSSSIGMVMSKAAHSKGWVSAVSVADPRAMDKPAGRTLPHVRLEKEA